MEVPGLGLKAQYEAIGKEMLAAVQAVMESQRFVNGPAIAELEQTIAQYSSCAAAAAVSSGTDALLVSMMALGIGPGDEVITTPFTFFATAGCIARCGAKPVFVDIDPATFNIDPALIEAAVTPRTKAIIPVHLYGQMADMDAIVAVAHRHNLYVIEDAAQAIGAECKSRRAGSIGTVGCLSFYPTKNLGGIGDGGMVVTQDQELAARIRIFRDHGQSPTYFYKWIGGNFRLDTIQAAALCVKMKYLKQWTLRRNEIAAQYNKLLAGAKGMKTPVAGADKVHVYNQYVVRVSRRDEMQAFLKSQGVATGIYYPLCLHEQECFRSLGYAKGDFPVAERAAAEVLALPMYAELTDEQVAYVAGKVKESLSR